MKKFIILLTSLFVNTYYSQVSFTLNSNVCSGVTNTLTANTGTDMALSYTWAALPSTPVFSSPNASITNINFPTSGTYTVNLNVTLSTGFSSYSSTVNVAQTPTISIAQSASTICITKNFPKSSQLVTFTASGSSASYTWSPITFVSGPDNNIAWGYPIFPVCYTAASAVGMCTGFAVACVSITPQYSITVSASSSTVCSSDSLHLNVSGISSSAVLPIQKYKWYDPLPVSIANASVNPVTISPSASSTYTVETVDNNGCVSLPSLVTVSVVSCTGFHSNSIDETILSIYPNPANEVLNIDYRTLASTISATNLKLEIINTLGQVVYQSTITSSQSTLNIETLSKGVYILKIHPEGKTFTSKFLKN